MQMILFQLTVFGSTDTEPPYIECTDPRLRPERVDEAFSKLGIPGYSKRQLARQRKGEIENPLPFNRWGKTGRMIEYDVDEVNKRLREIWEVEQRKKNQNKYR